MIDDETRAYVRELVEREVAKRLPVWRPARTVTTAAAGAYVLVALTGDAAPVRVRNLTGLALIVGRSVYCMILPNGGAFAMSVTA